MGFTRRLVFVYTCILVIPLFGFVLYGTTMYRNQSYDSLVDTSSTQVHEYAERIRKNYDTLILVETAVTSDENFQITLLRPETVDSTTLIDTIVDEETNLSRLSIVLPDVYAIRVFTNHPGVPERWPFVLQTTRENFDDLSRYSYNYVARYLGNQLSSQSESLCYTKPIVHRKSKRQVGFLQVTFRMEDMFPQLYQNLHEDKSSGKKNRQDITDYVYKTSPEGTLIESVTTGGKNSIYSDLSSKWKEKVNDVILQSKQVHGSQIVHIGSDSQILTWEIIPQMNLVAFQLNSTERLDSQVFLFRILIFIVLIVIIFLFSLVIRFVTSRLLDRVYNVMDGLRQVSDGNMNVTLTVDGQDEVAETQRAFNVMTEQLRTQIQTIKEEQSLLADTEIKAMQNQINAHFLYNVLETIKMQAVLKDQDDISESLTVLGKMMRYCLRWRIHRVTVQQEIEYICSYVYILNLRNDYLITLNIDIPSECECIEIPKMVLQPVIENSFTYAIEPMAQDSEISVSARIEDDRLWLCVRDYGDGMAPEKLAGIRSYLADKTYERDTKGSIGLKNIQQRLYMFYGEEYSIQIESQCGWGTEIRIPVPAVKGV